MHQHYQVSNLIEILLNFFTAFNFGSNMRKRRKNSSRVSSKRSYNSSNFFFFFTFSHTLYWMEHANVGPIPYLQAREVLKDLARCFTNRSNPWHIDKPNTNFQRDLNLMIEADRETQKQQPKGQKSSDPDRHLQDDRWQDKRKKTVSRMQSYRREAYGPAARRIGQFACGREMSQR